MQGFVLGQKVKCMKCDDELSGPALEQGRVYTVADFNSPEECATLFPGKDYWQENGGRVMLVELPRLEWFGRRFEVLKEA